MCIIMIVCTRLNLPVLCTTAQLTKVYVNWSVVITFDSLALAILFDENNELMAIVNGNALRTFFSAGSAPSIPH